jgi:hypothetical protein
MLHDGYLLHIIVKHGDQYLGDTFKNRPQHMIQKQLVNIVASSLGGLLCFFVFCWNICYSDCDRRWLSYWFLLCYCFLQ